LKQNSRLALSPYSEQQRQSHLRQHKTHNNGHGRIETCHIQASSRLAGLLDWPGLQQVCRVERTRKICDKTSVDVQYAITGLRADQAEAKELLDLVRGRWASKIDCIGFAMLFWVKTNAEQKSALFQKIWQRFET
jgi:hypothetical protein